MGGGCGRGLVWSTRSSGAKVSYSGVKSTGDERVLWVKELAALRIWDARHSKTVRIEAGVVAALVLVFLLVAISSCQPVRPSAPGATVDTTPALTPAQAEMEARFPSVYAGEPDLRVRLKRRTGPMTIGLESDPAADSGEQLTIRTPGIAGVTLAGPVHVVATSAGVVLRLGDAQGEPVFAADAVADDAVLAIESADGVVRIGDVAYPARVLLVPATGGDAPAVDVVLEMPIERYLPRVLAAELYKGWPSGAYEAQSVAARSYALHERARSRSRGRAWDVESTTADQAFSSAPAGATSTDAVATTRGMVLRAPEGGVLRAYYSSTCGGRDASARDTFPTTKGFEYNRSTALDAHPREHLCQDAPRYTWSVRRDAATYATRLRAWGTQTGHPIKGLRTIAAITPERRNALGRPVNYRVRDTSGEAFTIGAENLRVASNARSGRQGRPSTKRRVHSNDMVHRLRGGTIEIGGRGFGHGVGLCQYDAKAFAERGDTWQQMMQTFYPGAELIAAYE